MIAKMINVKFSDRGFAPYRLMTMQGVDIALKRDGFYRSCPVALR